MSGPIIYNTNSPSPQGFGKYTPVNISADVLKLNDVTQLHVTYEMCLDVHMFIAVVIAPAGPKLDAGLVVLPDDGRFSLRFEGRQSQTAAGACEQPSSPHLQKILVRSSRFRRGN